MLKTGVYREIYINEIIRITYKCNWKCKFCNVSETNNFGGRDVTHKEIIYKILTLAKKYSKIQRGFLILSFSGGEPTLNKSLLNYIKLAKSIGIGTVQIQTNGTVLFKNKGYINLLIDVGLDEIFLAQHSGDIELNKKMGIFYNIDDFVNWVSYILEHNIFKRVQISFNIVINKINISNILVYLLFLKNINFFKLLPLEDNNGFLNTKRISFGLVQPNGYANINKEDILLKYNDSEVLNINKVIDFCRQNNIYPDFHFTAPPLCVLYIPNYNLEYHRLISLEYEQKEGIVNKENLNSYKNLWKEKQKFGECIKCKYNNYCLGFYKNWIKFVGKEYVRNIINLFV